MTYFELYKNFLKAYHKEYDNSDEHGTCWRKKSDNGKFVVCEEKPLSLQEPEIFCRVRRVSRPYADTEIIIDVKAEKRYSEDEIVNFIQKNVDVECKKYNAPDLNWWFDRYRNNHRTRVKKWLV